MIVPALLIVDPLDVDTESPLSPIVCVVPDLGLILSVLNSLIAIETYNECCSANVDLTFEFGISKMAAVTMATAHLAIGEGCHPLLLAMANLVFIILLQHFLSTHFLGIVWTNVDGTLL